MATDQSLLRALREHLGPLVDCTEQRITGGTGFMWRGNLVCGVQDDELLVRLDRETGAGAVGRDGAHPMTMGRRSSLGWMRVPVPPHQRAELLDRWVTLALRHSETLPPKG